MSSSIQSGKARGSYLISGLVLLVGLTLTAVTVQAIHLQAHKQADTNQSSQANMLSLRVGKKLTAFEQLLSSAQVFLQSTNDLDSARWQRFASSLNLNRNYPGAVSVGYTEVIGANDDNRIETATRYLKPRHNSNRHLIGNDLATSEGQLKAMIKARDFGQISVSKPTDLRQLAGINSLAGLIIYMPVYRGIQTPEWITNRRTELRGFVFLVADITRLLEVTASSSGIEFPYMRLYDGYANELGTLVEELPGNLTADAIKSYDATLMFAGRLWTLSTAAPDHSELEHNQVAKGVKMGGLVLSILLALTAWFQVAGRRRERQLVKLNEELVWTQQMAEQASKAKSAFLATMSHEIRTPMNGVIGMVDVLAATQVTTDQRGMIQIVRQSGLSLLRLIDDILDFSKIESEMLYIERIEFELEPLAREVAHSLFAIAAEKQVRLNIYIDPSLPSHVWTDPTRLKQILFNLVGNAIKFSSKNIDEPGRVSVRFTPDDSHPTAVLIEVVDNGIGMTADTVATLFDAFTQAEISTTRRFGGSGLGLAICERLISMAGGSIKVKSKLHEGSTFAVSLPMLGATSVDRSPIFDLSGITCLLVNSPAFTRSDLEVYLRAAGAHTILIDSIAGIDGELLLQRANPTLVVGSATDLSNKLESGTDQQSPSAPADQVIIWRVNAPTSAATSMPRTVTLTRLDLLPSSFVKRIAQMADLLEPDTTSAATLQAVGAKPAADSSDTVPKHRRARILVAEDEPVNQQVIARQLDLLGYQAHIASNGIEALRLYHANEYDLLLTDLHMPDMDGYELTQAIRSMQNSKRPTPILMLSANAISGESERAKSFGVDEYLTKPVQIGTLREALGRWVMASSDTAPNQVGSSALSSRAASPSTILDLSVLSNLVDGDQEIADTITLEFRKSTRQAQVELADAMAAGDTAQIREIAHRIKSSAKTVGANRLSEVCAELETLAEHPTEDLVKQAVQACVEAATAVEQQIDEHLLTSP